MEKKEFNFYQDVKITTWVRQQFTVEAESKEEALKMVEKFKTEDIGSSDESHLVWNTEWQTEAWDEMTVEENGGCATIELYDAENREMIGDNAMPGLSAMEKPRRVMGYHLLDENGEFPEDLFSFMVFRTVEDVNMYARCKKLENIKIVTLYDGDVESPTFIGLRVFAKGERVFYDETSPNCEDLRGWGAVCKDTAELYADQVMLLKLDSGSETEVESGKVYQIAEGVKCPKCGGVMCIEHSEFDYPYYCPECDENFYRFECE